MNILPTLRAYTSCAFVTDDRGHFRHLRHLYPVFACFLATSATQSTVSLPEKYASSASKSEFFSAATFANSAAIADSELRTMDSELSSPPSPPPIAEGKSANLPLNQPHYFRPFSPTSCYH